MEHPPPFGRWWICMYGGRGNASEEPPDHIHNSLINIPHNTDSERRPQRESQTNLRDKYLSFQRHWLGNHYACYPNSPETPEIRWLSHTTYAHWSLHCSVYNKSPSREFSYSCCLCLIVDPATLCKAAPSSSKLYSWHNAVRSVSFSWHLPNPDSPITRVQWQCASHHSIRRLALYLLWSLHAAYMKLPPKRSWAGINVCVSLELFTL